jgi:hypothetical protein
MISGKTNLGCVALSLVPSWHEEKIVLVGVTDGLRLCRDGGYEAVSWSQAWQHIEDMQRTDRASLREFVAKAHLSSFPLSSVNDQDLAALLRNAVRSRSLVGLRAGKGAGGAASGSTPWQRQLVKKIEARGRLSHAGRQYKLVADADFSRLPGRDSYEVVRRNDAAQVLEAIASQPATPSDLAAMLSEARGGLARDWRSPRPPEGLVLLRRSPAPIAPTGPSETPLTPSQIEEALPIHWVEFHFRDAGARPIEGAHYTIALPSGTDKTGALDGQGKTRHEGQPAGSALLVLADVEEARWGASETDADDHVELVVDTAGIDAGQAVKFEIFRLYRERPGEVVAKLDGTIDDSGQARASWQPSSIQDADDWYVFKATVAGVWRKSAPLSVVHEVASATWSSAVATTGDSVSLRANVRGVPDGESAVFTVFQKFWHGTQDPNIAEIQSTVSDGVAEAAWTVPEPAESPARGDDGRRYLFFVAEAGGVFATSDLLTVEPSAPEEEP